MISQTTTPHIDLHLATLSEADLALLTDWLESDHPLPELARRHGLSLLALAKWATRPDIAAALQALRSLHESRARLKATAAAPDAVETLSAIVATGNPTNAQEIVRRAAAGILRLAFPDRNSDKTRNKTSHKSSHLPNHSLPRQPTHNAPATEPGSPQPPAATPPAATDQHHRASTPAITHPRETHPSPEPAIRHIDPAPVSQLAPPCSITIEPSAQAAPPPGAVQHARAAAHRVQTAQALCVSG
jgi:hypothetical protein